MSSPRSMAAGRTTSRPPSRRCGGVCKLGYRHEPHAHGVRLRVGAARRAARRAPRAVARPARRRRDRGRRRAACASRRSAWPLSAVATWFLRTVSTRLQRRFRDKVTIALESHVAQLQASVVTIAHQERPELLDRLSVLRDQVFVLDHMYLSVFSTAGFLLRLGHHDRAARLRRPRPAAARGVRAPDRGHLELAAGGRAAGRGGRRAVEAARLPPVHHRHDGGRRPRRCGSPAIGPRLVEQRRASWEAWYGPVARARAVSAVWHSLAWAVFGLAYVGRHRLRGVRASTRRPATCCSCWRPARACPPTSVPPSARSASCAASGWTGRSGSPGSRTTPPPSPPPPTCRCPSGIERRHPVRGRELRLPGHRPAGARRTSRLELPAGAVVAVVGENGAGKTTLVKLLAKLYEPTSGRILVDGVDLARVPADGWRARLAGAFQDFFRFELRAQHSVGLGDLPRLRRRAGRRSRRSSGPGPTTSIDRLRRRASTPSSGPPGPRAWR